VRWLLNPLILFFVSRLYGMFGSVGTPMNLDARYVAHKLLS
jgi:hypothetical protein